MAVHFALTGRPLRIGMLGQVAVTTGWPSRHGPARCSRSRRADVVRRGGGEVGRLGHHVRAEGRCGEAGAALGGAAEVRIARRDLDGGLVLEPGVVPSSKAGVLVMCSTSGALRSTLKGRSVVPSAATSLARHGPWCGLVDDVRRVDGASATPEVASRRPGDGRDRRTGRPATSTRGPTCRHGGTWRVLDGPVLTVVAARRRGAVTSRGGGVDVRRRPGGQVAGRRGRGRPRADPSRHQPWPTPERRLPRAELVPDDGSRCVHDEEDADDTAVAPRRSV